MPQVTEEIVAHNSRFAKGFAKGALPMPPSRKVAILTCMDARIVPEEAFGVGIGDAHVIRNAGGRASDDAIRSLIISNELLGTEEFLVIHHTDCGMLTFRDEDLGKRLTEKTGIDASWIRFLAFSDVAQSVRDDVEAVRTNPFIPKDIPVRGFVYDVRTGRLSEVKN